MITEGAPEPTMFVNHVDLSTTKPELRSQKSIFFDFPKTLLASLEDKNCGQRTTCSIKLVPADGAKSTDIVLTQKSITILK